MKMDSILRIEKMLTHICIDRRERIQEFSFSHSGEKTNKIEYEFIKNFFFCSRTSFYGRVDEIKLIRTKI